MVPPRSSVTHVRQSGADQKRPPRSCSTSAAVQTAIVLASSSPASSTPSWSWTPCRDGRGKSSGAWHCLLEGVDGPVTPDWGQARLVRSCQKVAAGDPTQAVNAPRSELRRLEHSLKSTSCATARARNGALDVFRARWIRASIRHDYRRGISPPGAVELTGRMPDVVRICVRGRPLD